MVKALFDSFDFDQVEIIGINYFGNFLIEMCEEYQEKHTIDLCQTILNSEEQFCHNIPIEYARHALIIARKPGKYVSF